MWRRALIASGLLHLLGCTSLGEGEGEVLGTLNVPDCWAGPFRLYPDFFAAVPYRESLTLRIQNGGDYQTFSDGLSFLIDDVTKIRGGATSPSRLGATLSVGLPPGVSPPGIPLVANPDPAPVHAVLYLQRSCRTQNVALYAMPAVTLADDSSCAGSADAGAGTVSCSAPESPERPVGKSTMTFQKIFNGKPDEPSAEERLTDATFDLYLADPRELCPGGQGPPPPCRGHVKGYFRFYFQRGKPAQPFP